MMKNRFLICVFLLISISVQSQVLISLLFGDKLNSDGLEFGLEGGMTYSTINGLESNDMASNFYLGFYFDIRIKNEWSLDTGLMVKSTLGNDDLTEGDLEFLDIDAYDNELEGKYEQKLSYFILPALIKYKFDNHIYLEAGPQFGLLRKGWVQFDYDHEGNSGRIKQTNTDNLNRFDMGVTAGTGFRLLKGMGWTVGAKYYYGLLDVYKDLSGSNNSAIFLKLNVPIGLSTDAKKEIEKHKKTMKEGKAERKRKRQEEKQAIENKSEDL